MATLLHNEQPGTIITFSGREWVILDQMPDGTTYILLNSNTGNRAFDTDNTQLFNPSDSNNIGFYLNNTFYNSLSQKDLILDHSWDIRDENGTVKGGKSHVTAKIGLISYSEYITYRGNVLPQEGTGYYWWTITPYSGNSAYVYIVGTNGSLFSYLASFSRVVRPALYLKSGILVSDTKEIIDVTPPHAPTGLSGFPIGVGGIQLDWDTNTDPDIASYNVYRDGVKVGETATNSYADNELLPGVTYTFTVTAVDDSGNESEHSESVAIKTLTGIKGAILPSLYIGNLIPYQASINCETEKQPVSDLSLISRRTSLNPYLSGFDTSKDTAIVRVFVDQDEPYGSVNRYLVSFDQRQTWLAYFNHQWQQVNPDDIKGKITETFYFDNIDEVITAETYTVSIGDLSPTPNEFVGSNLQPGVVYELSKTYEGPLGDRALYSAHIDHSKYKFIHSLSRSGDNITLTGIPLPQVVLTQTDIEIPADILLRKVTVNGSEQGGVLRILVSPDQGLNWYSWYGDRWIKVSPANLNDFSQAGMRLATFNNLGYTAWDLLIQSYPAKLRFAFYLELKTVSDIVQVSSVTVDYLNCPYLTIADSFNTAGYPTLAKVSVTEFTPELSPLYLVSFDGRKTWYSFANGAWKLVDIRDIGQEGMTAKQMANIQIEQWKIVFASGTLDIAVYLDQIPASLPVDKFSLEFYTKDTGMTAWQLSSISKEAWDRVFVPGTLDFFVYQEEVGTVRAITIETLGDNYGIIPEPLVHGEYQDILEVVETGYPWITITGYGSEDEVVTPIGERLGLILNAIEAGMLTSSEPVPPVEFVEVHNALSGLEPFEYKRFKAWGIGKMTAGILAHASSYRTETLTGFLHEEIAEIDPPENKMVIQETLYINQGTEHDLKCQNTKAQQDGIGIYNIIEENLIDEYMSYTYPEVNIPFIYRRDCSTVTYPSVSFPAPSINSNGFSIEAYAYFSAAYGNSYVTFNTGYISLYGEPSRVTTNHYMRLKIGDQIFSAYLENGFRHIVFIYDKQKGTLRLRDKDEGVIETWEIDDLQIPEPLPEDLIVLGSNRSCCFLRLYNYTLGVVECDQVFDLGINYTIIRSTEPALITTTDLTQFHIKHCESIAKVNIDHHEYETTAIKYLVSFDDRRTWWTHDGYSWLSADPANIGNIGMSATTIESIPEWEWRPFVRGANTLDFMIYLNPKVMIGPLVKSVTVSSIRPAQGIRCPLLATGTVKYKRDEPLIMVEDNWAYIDPFDRASFRGTLLSSMLAGKLQYISNVATDIIDIVELPYLVSHHQGCLGGSLQAGEYSKRQPIIMWFM